jgi:outer membrane protein
VAAEFLYLEIQRMEKKLMKKKVSLFIGLMMFASMSVAELKIGFVNVPKVMEKAPQAAQAKKRLEKEFSPRDKQLVAQQKEIKKLEEKLARDASVMGENERSKVQREIISKKREATRAQQEFSEDFNLRRNEELKKLQKRIYEAILSLAKEENYDLLLTEGVIHASDAINVTAEVHKKLTSAE